MFKQNMGMVYEQEMCVLGSNLTPIAQVNKTEDCYQTVSKAYYQEQADTGGTLVTALQYAL